MLQFYIVRLSQYVTEENPTIAGNLSHLNSLEFTGTLYAADDKQKEWKCND